MILVWSKKSVSWLHLFTPQLFCIAMDFISASDATETYTGAFSVFKK